MTYWVDQSCTDRAEWDEAIITDAIRLAKSSFFRNGVKSGDSTFQDSFKNTFAVRQDSTDEYTLSGGFRGTPYEIVEYITGSLSTLTSTSNQAASNIRVYCDMDPMVSTSNPNARWKLVANREGDPKGPNNEKTLGVDQEWFDQINFLRRSPLSLGCQGSSVLNGGKPLLEAFPTAIKDLTGYNAPADITYYRTVISLCEAVFNRIEFPKITYQDIPRGANFARVAGGLNNDYFRLPISAAFAHELRHAGPFKLKDADGLKSYFWENVVKMTPDISLDNADSHLYLDILAELESRHWRLSSDASKAVDGVLVYDPSIS